MSERFDTFRPPPPKPDPYDEAAAVEAPGDDEALDPAAAAALLATATQQVERQLDRHPPLLMLGAAVVVLGVYGTLWLSVRHQHPYVGPAGWALGVVYGTLAVWIGLNIAVRSRATRGLSGTAMRQGRNEGLVFAVIWIFVYVFQGGLAHAGASHAIAYGIYPAVAPLLIVGSAAAAHQAALRNWSWARLALGAVMLAGVASYFGPRAVWGILAIGLSTLLFLRFVEAWVRRR